MDSKTKTSFLKSNYFFLGLLLLTFFAIRLAAVDLPLFDDETNYIQSWQDPGLLFTVKPFSVHPHPPLGPWLFMGFARVFGPSTIRFLPLLLWLINSVLLFMLVTKRYSKRAAYFSVLLFGVSFYSVLASLQVDVEGSLLVTCVLFMYYFYLEAKNVSSLKLAKDSSLTSFFTSLCSFEKHELFNYLFTGIAFGLALLTKINALFFFCILLLYQFIENLWSDNFFRENSFRTFSFQKYLIDLVVFFGIGIVALLVFLPFIILLPEQFASLFSHSTGYASATFSILAPSMLLFWATPLLLGLFCLQQRKCEQRDLLWSLWFWTILVIFTFLISGRPGTHGVTGGVADYSRHFMNLLIPLAIMGGAYLDSSIGVFTRKDLWKGALLTGGFVGLFFLINAQTRFLVQRNFSTYLSLIFSGDFNFFFSFVTSSGNFLAVNMGILLLVSSFMSCLVVILLWESRSRKVLDASCASYRAFLLLFLAMGLAINLFLVVEYLGPVTSPPVQNAFEDLVEDLELDPPSGNIYSNDEGLLLAYNQFHVERDEGQFYLGRYFESSELPTLDLSGSTVLVMNWPVLPANHEIWERLDRDCHVEFSSYFKGQVMSRRYSC